VNVIVVGCGRVGSELAWALYRAGQQVTIIDFVGTSFQHLNPAYRGRMIEAEALNEGVLKRAGIEAADGLAAVTNSDATNAIVCYLARAVFHVPRVVSRNYDPKWRPLHEAMGLQAVSSTAWGAQRIEELLSGPAIKTVFSAGNGEVEVYELGVTTAWAGRPLGELLAGAECVPVALSRAGRATIPEAGTALEVGDVLHLSATLSGAVRLRRRLEGQGEV
jgi:trk system potassium uptake protein TrkA